MFAAQQFATQTRPATQDRHLERLKKRHEALKAQIAELESRVHLTSEEALSCRMLKKKKLATKDALIIAERSLVVGGH